MNISSIAEYFTKAFSELLLSYLIFAIPFFIAFWLIWNKNFQSIKIQIDIEKKRNHFVHDLIYSGSSIFIFALIDTLLLSLQKNGYTFLYHDINMHGYFWLFLSAFIILFFTDAYFYWTHRAMHHRKFYKVFHKVHHKNTDPSPLTIFAFHPLEAIIENLPLFILTFIIPIHFGIIIFAQLFDMLNNVLGHLGYELYPKNWTKVPFVKYKTTSTHHNMHHEKFNGNYGLYFTWWDKWFKTEFKDYAQRHQEIFQRENCVPAGSPARDPALPD